MPTSSPPTERPAEAASRRVRELQGKALAALGPRVQAAVDAQEQGSARWLTCAGMRPRHVASSTTIGAPTRSGSTGGARRRISRTCGSKTTLLVSPCSGTARPTSRDTCRPVTGSRIRPWRALGRADDCVSKTSVGCAVPAGPAVYGMSRSSVRCDVPAGPAVDEVYRRSVGGVALGRAARRRPDAAGSNARPQRRPSCRAMCRATPGSRYPSAAPPWGAPLDNDRRRTTSSHRSPRRRRRA